jgi:2-succinyl-5-enolpyruvyl-6-hydroxy-3-cyclohexene-1-carboxylate synthase
MKDSGSKTTRILFDVMERHGIGRIVLSPGSRNAPLLISASQRKHLKKYIIPDERTASFVALGMGISTGEAIAIACTSGTAMYNYSPAIAEAYYQHIPLIVITADRPSQWIDQDDSQTVRQYGSLDNIVKGSFNLPLDSAAEGCANRDFHNEAEWFANRTVNEAILLATDGNPGPVHINIQLDTPLGRIIERDDVTVEGVYKERKIREISNASGLLPALTETLAEELVGKRIMVTAGFMPPSEAMERAVRKFASLPNVTLLAETLSNLHTDGDPYLIDGLLTRVSKEDLQAMRPDIVISIGGSLVSRMLKEYLRGSVGTEHWTLGDSATTTDCYQRLTTHIDVLPHLFFDEVADAMARLSEEKSTAVPAYREMWDAARKRILPEYRKEISESGWSELKGIKMLCDTLPKHCNLFLSNGTPVRYAQLCMESLPDGCYGNRGVSGIDGTNATAMGIALGSEKMTILLTGDMSFSYCPQIMGVGGDEADLRIIVINNSGGGIFRFIKTTRDLEMREQYFCAPTDVPIKELSRAYGWEYLRAENEEEMQDALQKLYSSKRCILEMVVEPQASATTLIEFLKS